MLQAGILKEEQRGHIIKGYSKMVKLAVHKNSNIENKQKI